MQQPSQYDRLQDWALFLALMALSLVVLFTGNRSMNQSLRAYGLELTARIDNQLAWIERYTRALQENEVLRARNIELAGEVARSRDARQRNDELEAMLSLQTHADTVFAERELVAARILQKDITQQHNLLTLDVGRRDSVETGMAVLTPDGIVGTVLLTSERFSQVMPFLNTDFRVPGVISAIGAEGMVQWEGDRLDALSMHHVVQTEPVEAGQQVVASTYSGVFPAGWPIGTIDYVETQTGRNDLAITLRPAVSLHATSHVFVALRPDRLEALDDQFEAPGYAPEPSQAAPGLPPNVVPADPEEVPPDVPDDPLPDTEPDSR